MEADCSPMDLRTDIKIESVWHVPEEENHYIPPWEPERLSYPRMSPPAMQSQWMPNSIPITFPLWNLKADPYSHCVGSQDYLGENRIRPMEMVDTRQVGMNSFGYDQSMIISPDNYGKQVLEDNEVGICEYKSPGLSNSYTSQHEEFNKDKGNDTYISPLKRIPKLPLKDKPYICLECNVGYISKMKFQNHIRKHAGKNLVCQVCNIAFFTRKELKSHSYLHTRQCEFKCKKCNCSFPSKLALTGHSRMHAADKCFKCKECDRWFTTRMSLKYHSQTHATTKCFKCTKCDKEYATRPGLRYHLTTHNSEKLHSCTECDKRFRTKQSLRLHAAAHFKKKYFKCPDCEKRFFTKSQLRHHERIHAAEKSFQCKKCDKSFTTREGFGYHMKTHVWEGNITCIVCDKKVKETNVYRCTLVSQGQNESFNYTFCRECFKCNMSVAEEEEDKEVSD